MTLQTTLLFVFGLIALTTRVFLAVRFPNPTPDQQAVFRTVLALAGAGIAAIIPGMFDLKSHVASVTLSATGTIAVFVFIYLFNPGAVSIERRQRTTERTIVRQRVETEQRPAGHVKSLMSKLDRMEFEIEKQTPAIPQRALMAAPPTLSRRLGWAIAGIVVCVLAIYLLITLPKAHWMSLFQLMTLRIVFSIFAGAIGGLLARALPVESTPLRWAMRVIVPVVLFSLVYFLGGATS